MAEVRGANETDGEQAGSEATEGRVSVHGDRKN